VFSSTENLNRFTVRRIFAALIGVFAFTVLHARAETNILTPEYLDKLRAAVRAEHPSVAAAQARIRAADANVRAVRLWENPMVGAAYMAAEKMMQEEDGDFMFDVEQTLPRRKLYHAERAKMRAEKSMAAADLQSTALKLETLVARTAIELTFADEMLAIDTNQVQWLDRMAVNARERLKDPMGMASEALRMESELAMEKQKLDSNALMRRRLARQLNILLGRPADEPWPTLHLPDNSVATPALESELAKIAAANPMLQGLAGASEAARSEIEIARRMSKPMYSVGVDTRVYSGGDFRSATIGAKMTIPLFNRAKYRAKVEAAKDQHEAAQKEIEATERELRSELVMAYTDAENAAHQAKTFATEIIPRAEQAAESTQNAWISSKANLLEVLESRRAALNARLEERRSIAAQHAALETLRSIVPPKNTQP
jgi:outer membrane protein, heavy metal efflux system